MKLREGAISLVSNFRNTGPLVFELKYLAESNHCNLLSNTVLQGSRQIFNYFYSMRSRLVGKSSLAVILLRIQSSVQMDNM